MANKVLDRPDPERLLDQVEKEERQRGRGTLKVFLGYASGVGKSFQMLDEGRRRRERGEDVVIGALQPRYGAEIQKILELAEVIPPVEIEGRQVMDVEAIVRRRPQVVLVDGLAYDNPPGSRNPERWLDVHQILESGISVIASVNLQYIAECQNEIEGITGKRAACSIPLDLLDTADEIVVVDAPSEKDRLRPAEGSHGLAEDHGLARLREMALLVAAAVVERQLESYLKGHGLDQLYGTQERILVCVTPKSNARQMIASGRRNADRFHAELHVAYVRQPALSRADQAALECHLAYARELGAQVSVLTGLDPLEAVMKLVRAKNITQIYIGHSLRQGGWRRLWRSIIDRMIVAAEGIDVIIFPH